MAELNLPCFAKLKRATFVVFFSIGNTNENVKNTSIAVKRVLSPSLGCSKQLIYYNVLMLFPQRGITGK